MATYNVFNYNYRPAKSIERKMFVELLKEIYGVVNAKKCTYIGFGSIFFSDFRMVHKELGISKMVNIDNKEDDRLRFEYNKPYSCIDLKWGNSTDVLPELDWTGKKIIWLDYDETLQPYMFDDLETIFSNIEVGSFYFFTCNNSLPKYFDRQANAYSLKKFQEDFPGIVPFGTTAVMLTASQSHNLIQSMLISQINHFLEQRNAILPQNEHLCYCQMLFISYKDRAPMMSTGGIVVKRSELSSLKKSTAFKLPYIRTGVEAIDIQSPVLTNSEIDLINTHLPKSQSKFLKLKKLGFIPEEEKKMYHGIYRYYPSFVEIRDF